MSTPNITTRLPNALQMSSKHAKQISSQSNLHFLC